MVLTGIMGPGTVVGGGMGTMDREMVRSIEAVLARVREPESNLAVGELGLVERFRLVADQGKLLVVVRGTANPKACCFVLAKVMEAAVLDRVRSELELEFPDLEVELV